METGMKGSFTTRKGALYCIVMTCLCSLLATGCASKYGAQTTDVHYYPDCYQPIADLRSAEKSFNTTMVMGTTMGALLGAVIGASQTGKAEGALAGAAIGGVSQYVLSQSLPGCMLCGAGAGAGASYLVAKYNNERDDRVRLASYARDLNADVNSLNRVTAAGQVAYNCYSAKFRAALEDYKAKRITRAELDQRYAEIKSGLAEASAILGSTLSEADKREAEYRQVLTIEAKKASRPIPPVQTVATTSKKTSKATKTVTRKQTSDQLQNLSNGVGSYKESTAQLTAVKSDLDEIQLQMDKVMLAQG